MVKVLFNNTVLANCDAPVILEGNYYFPPESVTKANLAGSNTSTASYYSADVDGKIVKDIAWYYAEPQKKAAHIKNHVAFYKDKVVIED